MQLGWNGIGCGKKKTRVKTEDARASRRNLNQVEMKKI